MYIVRTMRATQKISVAPPRRARPTFARLSGLLLFARTSTLDRVRLRLSRECRWKKLEAGCVGGFVPSSGARKPAAGPKP